MTKGIVKRQFAGGAGKKGGQRARMTPRPKNSEGGLLSKF
jgi:hypothetical protein